MDPKWPASFRDLFSDKQIAWQCFFGSYCVGLDRLLPISLVICLDEGGDFDLIQDQCGIRFASVEKPGVRRFNWIGSGIEVATERCRQSIASNLSNGSSGEWWITSTPASKQLEDFCRQNSYRYVGMPADAASGFKHKRRLYESLKDRDLPRSEGRWLGLSGRTFAELSSEFGSRFVVQQAVGAAGSGTHLVSDEISLRAAWAALGDESVYVSPHLGDLSLNINAAVIGGAAYMGFPNVQLSGAGQLAAPWGGYCGNDYTAAGEMEASIIRDVQDQTGRIGEWMAAQGFEGLYGLDFVVGEEDGRAYAVDLNPRWQGSTSLSIQAELAAGTVPLAAAEFAWRCGVLGRDSLERWRDDFSRPVRGAQMCLRIPKTQNHVVPVDAPPGLYRSGTFVRSAFRLEDCGEDNAWILTGGVPRRGTVVDPGAWLARILTKGRVVGASSSALSGWASSTADKAYRLLGIDH